MILKSERFRRGRLRRTGVAATRLGFLDLKSGAHGGRSVRYKYGRAGEWLLDFHLVSWVRSRDIVESVTSHGE